MAGIYQLSVPATSSLLSYNCYLLKDGADAYLVDTTWPTNGGWERLMGLFEEAEVEPSRLSGIILTHSHGDHTGYLERLQELSGAPVLLNRAEETAQVKPFSLDPVHQATWRAWFELHGAPDEVIASLISAGKPSKSAVWQNPRWLNPGEVIPVGSMNWEVVFTPGHSPGHICLLERSRRLLITGDHILPHESPNVAVRPGAALNPLGTYIDSLRDLLPLPIEMGLPGHGEVFSNFDQVVRYLVKHHDARFNDVLGALGSGPLDAYRVACQIPWVKRSKRFTDLAPWDKYLAFGETVAHLECLAGWGHIRAAEATSQTLWALTGQATLVDLSS